MEILKRLPEQILKLGSVFIKSRSFFIQYLVFSFTRQTKNAKYIGAFTKSTYLTVQAFKNINLKTSPFKWQHDLRAKLSGFSDQEVKMLPSMSSD